LSSFADAGKYPSMLRSSPSRALLFVLLFLAQNSCDGCHRSGDAGTARDGAAGVGAAAASGDVGVPACDDYLAKYAQCVSSHVPAEKKKNFEDNLARTRSAWKALAANPGARPGLVQACDLALETARTSMQQYACTW
jgi:hypothetical protein